jgi:hypothetical protein
MSSSICCSQMVNGVVNCCMKTLRCYEPCMQSGASVGNC